MLDQVKAGDKVKFAAEVAGGQITVTRDRASPLMRRQLLPKL